MKTELKAHVVSIKIVCIYKNSSKVFLVQDDLRIFNCLVNENKTHLCKIKSTFKIRAYFVFDDLSIVKLTLICVKR